jgi:23S rRNA (guanine745-N1)-methyltransferase
VPALDEALALLRCPHCGAGLEREGEAVRCGEGHAFDVARQGYLSLLADPAQGGDTAEMVAARERVLAAGHFDRLAGELAAAIARALEAEPRPWVVDLGAGTGWYLARVLDRLPGAAGIALDLSKPALRRAARAHPRAAAAGCDAWGPLPLRDGLAAAVLDVFAPRNPPEIARVLRPGGTLAVVTPAEDHLGELVAPLGLLTVDARKDERLGQQLEPDLKATDRRELRWKLQLDRAGVRDVVAMGPSAFHIPAAELDDRVAALPDPIEVTAAVTITLAAA